MKAVKAFVFGFVPVFFVLSLVASYSVELWVLYLAAAFTVLASVFVFFLFEEEFNDE